MSDNHLVAQNHSEIRVSGIGMIGAIAKWCDCLQGRTPLRDSLMLLAESLDVEAIALTRASRDRHGEHNSFFYDTVSGGDHLSTLDRSFAGSVLGPYFRQPKPGSVWFKTFIEMEPDPRLERFHHRRKLTELAVIPLSVEEKSLMFLEMHFSAYRGSGQHSVINMCAPTLADTWSRRKPGLMTELILNRQQPQQHVATAAAILGPDNPAGLSRAEFRVCLLLSRGLSANRACQELKISESTLRTHLRSIYAKTDTCNQSELLYRLLAGPAPDHHTIRGVA